MYKCFQQVCCTAADAQHVVCLCRYAVPKQGSREFTGRWLIGLTAVSDWTPED